MRCAYGKLREHPKQIAHAWEPGTLTVESGTQPDGRVPGR